MAEIDLTQGFAELGQEAELKPYLQRLADLANRLPGAVDELVSYEDLNPHEGKVLQNFAISWARGAEALVMKYLMSGRVAGKSGHLTVDRLGSGLPIWQEMVTLSQDKEAAAEILTSMRSREELKASMLKAMLRDQLSPAPQQYAMSQRIYQETLAEGDVALPRSPLTFDRLEPSDCGRQRYMVGWSVIDVQSNCPVVYTMLLEDSSGGTADENDARLHRLRAALHGQSNLETGLLDMAIGVDHAVSSLHPKKIRRFTFGPFLSPAFSAASGPMMDLLRAAAPASEEEWALRIRMETVRSHGEFQSGGILSSTRRQEFTPSPQQRDGYLMTTLAFQAVCENHSDDFRGVRKYVITGKHQITAHG